MNEYKLGQSPIVIGNLASDPATQYAGEMYFNTTSQLIRYSNGSAWANITSGSGTVTSVSVTTANGFAGTVATATSTPAITISTTVTGLLQGNGTAISAYTGGNLTDSTGGLDGIVVTNGTGAVIGSGTSIAQAQASASQNGYLAQADWTTFNSKLSSTLTQNYIFVGNASNVATGVPMSGDATIVASGALTLATVNSNVGSFGSSTSIPSFTVNAKGLITAASGNAVVAPAGTLSGTTLNSTVVSSSLTSLGTQSQTLNMGTNFIINVEDPVNPQDAATKHYVDSAIAGLEWKPPVQAISVSANVPLTGSTPLVVDGYTALNGDSLILADQTVPSQNGVYTVGIVSTTYTLTLRADSASPQIGYAYLVENGTLYTNSGWQINAISPNTTFVQFTGPQELVFNAPLSRTGNDVSLLYTNGLTLISSSLAVLASDASILVASGGISVQEDPAGAITTSGSGIKSNVDNATIGISSNQLYVKNQGIGTIQLANASVGTTQLQTNSVTNTILAQMAAFSLKGNNTGSTANASDLTVAQVTAMIGVTTATASSLVERDSSANTYQNQMNAQAPTGPQERLSQDGSNWLEVQYVHAITLTNNTSSPTAVDASTTFNNSVYAGFHAEYYIFDGSSPTIVRMGKLVLMANSDGSIASINDTFGDTADIGVVFSANFSSPNIQLLYTTTNTSNRTMRIKITRFLR